MEIGLPLSALKREEIYSFLGGLFVALSWLFFFLNLYPAVIPSAGLNISMPACLAKVK